MAKGMRTAPNDPHRLVSDAEYTRLARVAGQQTGTVRTGGTAQLTPGTLAQRAGTHSNIHAEALRAAVAGPIQSVQYTPQWVPGAGNLPGHFAESASETTIESPINMSDVVRQAIGDIQAQSAAQAASRAKGREAISGVQKAYGGEADRLEQVVADARRQGQADYTAAAQAAPEAFDAVRASAESERQRGYGKADELTEMALGFREERLGSLKDYAALTAMTARRGAENQLNRALQEVDRLAAVGEIDNAEERKAQIQGAHREQLGRLQATLSIEYNKVEDAARASADAYTLNMAAIVEARAQTTGVAMVDIERRLAQAEAQERMAGVQQQQLREISYAQLDMAASQLRASGAELEAEILLSPAMAEVAEEYAPLLMLAVQSYEAQEEANRADREGFWQDFYGQGGGAGAGAQIRGMTSFQGGEQPGWFSSGRQESRATTRGPLNPEAQRRSTALRESAEYHKARPR